jgi:hypothetical protein
MNRANILSVGNKINMSKFADLQDLPFDLKKIFIILFFPL